MIAAMVMAVHALLSAAKPGGIYAYITPSACWALVALAVLCVSGLESPRTWYNKTITFIAAAAAVAQIFILIDLGLLTGFGKSPLSFSPQSVAINLVYVLTGLLGLELSRAYLMKSYGKRRPLLTLGLVTLLYTLVNTSLSGLLSVFGLGDPLKTADYLGSTFLPTVSENLLASYLALLGGPIASLAYKAPLKAFEWFFPVLPDLSWGLKALLGVVPPMLGFVYVNQAVTPRELRRIGMRINQRDFARLKRSEKAERGSLIGWTALSMIGILMVWFSTGLLGVYPTIPLSGSMRPTMDVGDLAILVKAPTDKIKVGDIIHFWRSDEMVLHRVHKIRIEDRKLFITKGDANRAPDTDTVSPEQIRGKVIATLPMLGWASIYLKEGFSKAWVLLSSDMRFIYGALMAVASAASAYLIRNRRSRAIHRRSRGW
ncbi:MAG: signal peptidase I [Candidatus Bathyarchaeota archaeon]|nr:MAG: signal peptidase I [Candidatus Bathyarchaeota archaeon]